MILNKTDFDNKLKSFNRKITSNETKYSNFSLGRIYFTSNDGYQNMFACQPTFNVLELKNDKPTEYIISWKSKRLYKSKLIALHGAFLPNIKYFKNKIGIQFNSTPLVIERNNYVTKIVNVYIVYDLDNWPKNPLINFTLKDCLFGSTNIVKDNDKEKYVYSGYGIAFDGNAD